VEFTQEVFVEPSSQLVFEVFQTPLPFCRPLVEVLASHVSVWAPAVREISTITAADSW
jgi:hypothetical protein